MLRLVFFLLTISLAQEPLPFWRAKPRFYDRIQDREILVNVTSQNVPTGESPKHFLRAVGGGETAVPCARVFLATQKLDELAQASDYIKRSHFDPVTHILELDLDAFSHKTSLRIELIPHVDSKPQTLIYRVLSGPMAGYSGKLEFLPVGTKCDVGFVGEYKYDRFPIPKLFLEFGMEVVLQRLAFRSRSYLEEKLEPQNLKKEAPSAPSS